jgi:tonB-dependent receptor plug domain protein
LNAVKIDRMRVYFTANNPFIFTKCDYLKNYDPEKGGNDDDAPLSKQYVFGVNISF